MNIFWVLFGFRGRRNRAKFWLVLLLTPTLMWLLSILFFGAMLDVDALALGSINVLGFVIVAWIVFANSAKRLHDMNLSGWWAVLFYAFSWVSLPVVMMTVESHGLILTIGILSLAIVVIMGAQPGTVGPNKYGPDPLAKLAKAS